MIKVTISYICKIIKFFSKIFCNKIKKIKIGLIHKVKENINFYIEI